MDMFHDWEVPAGLIAFASIGYLFFWWQGRRLDREMKEAVQSRQFPAE